MPSTGYLGHYAVVSYGDTPTDVGQVRDISYSGSGDDVEITNNSSAGWKEFIPGLKDGGSIEFEVVYNGTNLETLHTQRGVKQLWKVVFKDEGATTLGTLQFQGFLTDFSVESPTDAEISGSLTVKVTGSVSFS